MMAHRLVVAACDETENLAAKLEVDFNRLHEMRGASSATLTSSISDAVKTMRSEDPLAFLAVPLAPEDLAARLAVAAMILREREIAARLDGTPS